MSKHIGRESSEALLPVFMDRTAFEALESQLLARIEQKQEEHHDTVAWANLVAERDEAVQEREALRKELDSRNAAIRSLDTMVIQRDAKITQRTAMLSQRNTTITRLEVERDAACKERDAARALAKTPEEQAVIDAAIEASIALLPWRLGMVIDALLAAKEVEARKV